MNANQYDQLKSTFPSQDSVGIAYSRGYDDGVNAACDAIEMPWNDDSYNVYPRQLLDDIAEIIDDVRTGRL